MNQIAGPPVMKPSYAIVDIDEQFDIGNVSIIDQRGTPATA